MMLMRMDFKLYNLKEDIKIVDNILCFINNLRNIQKIHLRRKLSRSAKVSNLLIGIVMEPI